MALSGSNTGALLPYTARNMLEEACSRAGIPPEGITGEIVFKFLDQLNLTLTSLLNRGIPLWTRQQIIVPCYQGENQMPLPAGTNEVQTLNLRTMFRQDNGVAFSTEGGDPDLAFDDDFDTACTQLAADGSIGMQFSTPTQVTTFGILSGSAGSWGLFFEYSQDGVSYTALGAASVTYTDEGEWEWFDLQGPPPGGALYWRLRSVGDTPLSVAELYFGNQPSEINLGPWNLDDYANMPNKFMQGQIVNFYQQKNISAPLLYVWPTPGHGQRYQTLVMWVSSYLDQVSDIMQALPVPQRWFEAITAMMARRLCRTLKEADFGRYDMLVREENEAVWLAQAEERDNSPTRYDFGQSYYTA